MKKNIIKQFINKYIFCNITKKINLSLIASFTFILQVFVFCFLWPSPYLVSTYGIITSGTTNVNQTKTMDLDKEVCLSNLSSLYHNDNNMSTKNNEQNNDDNSTPYKMAIVIDDFGSYDQSGVETLLKLNVPLTCAVLPNVDNTEVNIKQILDNNHECILHMPMASHVALPENWYGPIYIKNHDSKETINQKLTECFKQFPDIKGFNIHIGSGVSQNKEMMKTIYEFANENNLYFLDSRTIITNAIIDACSETDSIYLGRDVFLEADKNRSYQGVCFRLSEGVSIAKEKGYSIVIGHVGAEGGENTAKAIRDSLSVIKENGVEIVSLSEIFADLKNNDKLK